MSALENLIAACEVVEFHNSQIELIAAARAEQAELVEIASELVRALDPKTGRIVSDITRREMEPLARDAHDILAKHATCDHSRLNDHGDACLDCKAVYLDGRWQ